MCVCVCMRIHTIKSRNNNKNIIEAVELREYSTLLPLFTTQHFERLPNLFCTVVELGRRVPRLVLYSIFFLA